MNGAPTRPASSAHFSVADLRLAIRRALRHATWKTVAISIAIVVGGEAWLFVEMVDLHAAMSAAEAYASGTIINVCMVLSLVSTTLVADEIVAAGRSRLPAYAGAVVLGSAMGALAQWLVHRWLHVLPANLDVPSTNPIYDVTNNLFQAAVVVTQPAVIFFEFVTWASIIVFIYVNRRTALLAAARTHAAQLGRDLAQRRTFESRLQALQARVEPQFLFSTLAQVRDLYERDPEKGGRVLDDLIVYLRAALPHLRDSTSNLEQELRLVTAYLRIMRVRLDENLELDIDAPGAALAVGMPPMILLPLVDHIVLGALRTADARGAVRMAVRVDSARLQLEISAGSGRLACDELLHDINERLSALYGGRANLRFDASRNDGIHMVMEIPYGTANRDCC